MRDFMNVEGVVLAAGLSSRAGTYKMTLDLGGKTVIERTIEGMYELCSRIIVVGGFKVEKIIEILDKYPKVKVVENKNYMDGMFSSVKVGVSHVKAERFFFTPGDYPLINCEVYDMMPRTKGDIIIPKYEGRKGHPVLMKSYLIKELLDEGKYSNLRDFINSKGFTTVEVNHEGILMDIDTIEDYRRILSSNSCGFNKEV